MEKTCLDCFNLRAKIPLKGDGHLLQKRLFFAEATVWCREDHLTAGIDDRTRIYKNIFKNIKQHRQTFETARQCSDYRGEEDNT